MQTLTLLFIQPPLPFSTPPNPHYQLRPLAPLNNHRRLLLLALSETVGTQEDATAARDRWGEVDVQVAANLSSSSLRSAARSHPFSFPITKMALCHSTEDVSRRR